MIHEPMVTYYSIHLGTHLHHQHHRYSIGIGQLGHQYLSTYLTLGITYLWYQWPVPTLTFD
jgi:hypothetical protein